MGTRIGKMRKLRHLNLSNNRLSNISFSFKNLVELRYLNLSHNRLSFLDNNLDMCYNLESLLLQSNQLVQFDIEFDDLFYLTDIDLSNNELFFFVANLSNSFNLRSLDFSNNNIALLKLDLNECWFFESLDASNNIIEQAYFDFKGCSLLNDINLRNNKMKSLDLNVEWSPYLKKLYLDNNLLSELNINFSIGIEMDSITLHENHLSPEYLIGAYKTFAQNARLFTYENQYSPGLLKWQKINSSQSVYSLIARIEGLQIDWFFNDKPVKSNSNQLVINNRYKGLIECVLSHSELPDLTYSYKAYLNVEVPKEQVMALHNFYVEMQGDKWYSNEGWEQIKRGKRLPKSFTALHGIQLDLDGNVRSIELKNNHLRGYVPANFKAFKHLEHLDVANNEVAGFMTDDVLNPSLKTINMTGNFLRSFSADISQLDSLYSLNVSYNHLTEFSPVFADTVALKLMDVSHNRLDTIRYEAYSPNLVHLALNDNNLYQLNLDLTDCSQLDTIDLSMNYLKFEQLTPLLYRLPKKVGKLITGRQKVMYRLAYDNGIGAVYVNDVLDKTNTIQWFKAGEKLKTEKHYIGLKSDYYRDYSAFIENPFFPETSIRAVW
jgi:Leucine-rich repeat (LRR) protein